MEILVIVALKPKCLLSNFYVLLLYSSLVFLASGLESRRRESFICLNVKVCR